MKCFHTSADGREIGPRSEDSAAANSWAGL